MNMVLMNMVLTVNKYENILTNNQIRVVTTLIP